MTRPHWHMSPLGGLAAALVAAGVALPAATGAPADAAGRATASLRNVVADYDSELRGPDGRVDLDAMVQRLRALRVNTYFWLICHAATDWDDLKLFLPKARAAGIDVWAYLVPPSGGGGTTFSAPFGLDFPRWGEELARLALAHPNLKAWVADDFCWNLGTFTPAYLRQMRERARRINPRLAFLPLLYFQDVTRPFVEDYHGAIDGVVIAYPQSREEIETAREQLAGRFAGATPGTLVYPWLSRSAPGDHVTVSQTASVLPAERFVLRLRETDNCPFPVGGVHQKQVLVDETVVWEEDVIAGTPGWRDLSIDLTDQVRGKREVTLSFRMVEKGAANHFGVTWSLRDLKVEGLRLRHGLDRPARWQVSRRGRFEAGFGPQPKPLRGKGRLPFIVMTAGQEWEFGNRHGQPVTTERIAEKVGMCLRAWHDGKCDGVVTYCLDKSPESRTYGPVSGLFRRYRR